jgi:hypothetical protein
MAARSTKDAVLLRQCGRVWWWWLVELAMDLQPWANGNDETMHYQSVHWKQPARAGSQPTGGALCLSVPVPVPGPVPVPVQGQVPVPLPFPFPVAFPFPFPFPFPVPTSCGQRPAPPYTTSIIIIANPRASGSRPHCRLSARTSRRFQRARPGLRKRSLRTSCQCQL